MKESGMCCRRERELVITVTGVVMSGNRVADG